MSLICDMYHLISKICMCNMELGDTIELINLDSEIRKSLWTGSWYLKVTSSEWLLYGHLWYGHFALSLRCPYWRGSTVLEKVVLKVLWGRVLRDIVTVRYPVLWRTSRLSFTSFIPKCDLACTISRFVPEVVKQEVLVKRALSICEVWAWKKIRCSALLTIPSQLGAGHIVSSSRDQLPAPSSQVFFQIYDLSYIHL